MPAIRRSKPLLAIAMGLLVAASLAGLASAAPNLPGNNGTIKIDDTPFDDAPTTSPMSAAASRSTSTAMTRATWRPP